MSTRSHCCCLVTGWSLFGLFFVGALVVGILAWQNTQTPSVDYVTGELDCEPLNECVDQVLNLHTLPFNITLRISNPNSWEAEAVGTFVMMDSETRRVVGHIALARFHISDKVSDHQFSIPSILHVSQIPQLVVDWVLEDKSSAVANRTVRWWRIDLDGFAIVTPSFLPSELSFAYAVHRFMTIELK